MLLAIKIIAILTVVVTAVFIVSATIDAVKTSRSMYKWNKQYSSWLQVQVTITDISDKIYSCSYICNSETINTNLSFDYAAPKPSKRAYTKGDTITISVNPDDINEYTYGQTVAFDKLTKTKIHIIAHTEMTVMLILCLIELVLIILQGVM